MSRTEVRLSGSGGQGIVLAAALLADAAVATGDEVVATQSYGPEARGGASRAEVIVADHEIDYPEVDEPDITLCLSQEAFDTYAPQAPAGSLVVYDAHQVAKPSGVAAETIGLPFVALAEKRVGVAIAANIVALGALQALTGVVGLEALADAVRRRLPAKIVEKNLEALRIGEREGRRAGGRRAAAAGARRAKS